MNDWSGFLFATTDGLFAHHKRAGPHYKWRSSSTGRREEREADETCTRQKGFPSAIHRLNPVKGGDNMRERKSEWNRILHLSLSFSLSSCILVSLRRSDAISWSTGEFDPRLCINALHCEHKQLNCGRRRRKKRKGGNQCNGQTIALVRFYRCIVWVWNSNLLRRQRNKEKDFLSLSLSLSLAHWKGHFSSPLAQNTASIWVRVMGIEFAHVLLLLACVRIHCSLIGFKFQVQRERKEAERQREWTEGDQRVKDCQCEMKNAYTKNASTKKL